MAWYVTQSLLIILATFILGLIVGWLWWGRVWRRVPFGESDAVRAVSQRYQSVVAERDAEIEWLGLKVSSATPSVMPASATDDAADLAGARTAPGIDSATYRSATHGSAAHGSAAHGSTAPGSDAHGSTARAPQTAEPPELPQPDEPAEPDNLQRIEGVGPRIAAALDGAGLRTYRAIAGADEEQLSAALREAGLSFAPSLVTWHLQARLLAAGDEEGLAAIKAEMTAGRAHPVRPTPTTEPTSQPPTEPATEPTIEPTAEFLAGPPTEPSVEPTTEPERFTENGSPQDRSTRVRSALSLDVGTAVAVSAEPPQGAAGAGEADDEEDELERVEGIGPRIARALRRAGIHTYRQLAATDATTLQAALAASGLRFTPSLPTWSRQAALLAEGDEDGFLALTRMLVPDRESGRPS